MIVFAAVVILFARFFRAGLWGMVTSRLPRNGTKTQDISTHKAEESA
jgi:hypothetical protein